MRPDFDDEFLSVEFTEPAAPLSCLARRERLAQLRGVCPRCYQRHGKAVRAGQTPWAALVAAGARLPARSAGGLARPDAGHRRRDHPMTCTAFFTLVERDLRLRHVPFDRRQLEVFCASMAPLAFAGDNWAWWADTFLEAMGTEAGWRELGQRPARALYRTGEN